MATLRFEGADVHVHDGDTIASALFRQGVRTFTRSVKYHRRRGLYCLTGDCPNCLVTVDGEPGCHACTTDARPGQTVVRETGWPSAERDLLAIADRVHPLLPVGFYYKTFVRPRRAWRIAERAIRRATGVGRLPVGAPRGGRRVRHVPVDVLVIGGGVAGLAAARAAAEGGASVVVCDEDRLGARVPPGPTRDAIGSLADDVRSLELDRVTILERHIAVGVYEGPSVPLVGDDETVHVDPSRVIVATGAVETHGVFPGNDLPGVWLGRGAARMAGAHGVAPGERAVVIAGTAESGEHVSVLRAAGVDVVLADRVIAAEGRGRVERAIVSITEGERRLDCDALVLSLGHVPRDGLLRMADDAVGAGEVLLPGCTLEEAIESGARAGGKNDPAGEPPVPVSAPMGTAGTVCLCEDVSVKDLERAWGEGWRSSEILKRYTTATMGPCQGAMCGPHLARFAELRSGSPIAGARTTARPPARPVRLEDLAAGVDEIAEQRTALQDRHLALGGRLGRSGTWIRPFTYGDVSAEIRAVREAVSIMDVGTLAKFLIAGPDAVELVDRVFPCRVRDLEPGRSRYLIALDEAGYVMDDGLVSALDGRRYYVTSTSGGADRMEAWLRNWADRWNLRAFVIAQTAMLGAINVAGPRARELMERLTDDPIDAVSLPYPGHREIEVAGIPCRAIRVGFIGELSFELHHPCSLGVELWDALLRAGADLGIRPHGLDALDVLRLEKGHVYLGQDTLPDDHPAKLGMGWAVAMGKPAFVGRAALERLSALPLERKLVGLAFDGEPQRGAPLRAGDRIVGRVTSCAHSRALGRAIGLGWLRAVEGALPERLRAGDVSAEVVPAPFYDPEGARLRA